MDWTKARPWLPLTGLVPVIWLGLYTMFWIDRADCAEAVAACLGDAFGNWAGDLVMLRWVDTTLGAGLLAVVAASAIFLNGAIERRAKDAEEKRRERKELLSAVAQVRAHFRRVVLGAVSNWDADPTIQNIDGLYAETASLAPHIPYTVMRLQFFISNARLRAVVWRDNADDDSRKKIDAHRAGCVAFCEMGFLLLFRDDIEKDEPEEPILVDREDLERLQWTKLNQDDREKIGGFIHVVDGEAAPASAGDVGEATGHAAPGG